MKDVVSFKVMQEAAMYQMALIEDKNLRERCMLRFLQGGVWVKRAIYEQLDKEASKPTQLVFIEYDSGEVKIVKFKYAGTITHKKIADYCVKNFDVDLEQDSIIFVDNFETVEL